MEDKGDRREKEGQRKGKERMEGKREIKGKKDQGRREKATFRTSERVTPVLSINNNENANK